MSKKQNLIGRTYQGMTVIAEAEPSPSGRSYWYCRTPFGELVRVRGSNLKSRKAAPKEPGLSPIKHTYARYRRQALERDLPFELSLVEFRNITQLNCEYCGQPPAQAPSVKTKKRVFINGLDRKDNNRGYILDNVVPCCGSCNRIKCHLLNYDEMRTAMSAVLELRRRTKI